MPIAVHRGREEVLLPFRRRHGDDSTDKQWGIPVAFSTKSLYWNKDLFAAAGLDPEKAPTTLAEEIAAAKTIKEKTGTAGFGVVAKTFDNTMHQFLHWVYSNDGTVIDADRTTSRSTARRTSSR